MSRLYSTTLEQHERHAAVTLEKDNKVYTLPYFWLRDHCHCSECYHPVTRQRQVNTFAIDRQIQPTAMHCHDQHLTVEWPGGHTSDFAYDWIATHGHTGEAGRDPLVNPQPLRLWTSKDLNDHPRPKLTYEEVIHTETGLATWLDRLETDGLAFVEDTPTTLEATETLARRLCFLRETHYSQGMWSFTADLAHADTAYTQLALGAHTDNTYFTEPSGLQMFHKLEFQGQGGDSLFVDGFEVARQLKEEDPLAYEVLSTTRIPTHSAGDEQVLIVASPRANPILNHDPAGDLYQIRYNNDDRSTLNHLSPAALDRFYDALFVWHKLLTRPENEYWDPLPPGRVAIFDNWRVLHGRSAFTGHRRICGAYFPWDDYKSRARTVRLSAKEKDRVL
ncbi:Trimethyllysine dioxygenase [Hesseltinella vesiculosa]|uniref:trimethyllysine dioxygenase n=1 Tax=Hesseltinella vesiculosa TaxID=101127 RepID=A0A1X2GMY3_9FUNG|nr:Trimethyllysine dioxygenase [Hesseltinella vesiculosa]